MCMHKTAKAAIFTFLKRDDNSSQFIWLPTFSGLHSPDDQSKPTVTLQNVTIAAKWNEVFNAKCKNTDL